MTDKRHPVQADERAEIDRDKLRRIGEGLRHASAELTTAELPTDLREMLRQLDTVH